MVGTDLHAELASRGEQVAALSHSDLDITDSRAVNARVEELERVREGLEAADLDLSQEHAARC